MEKYYTPSIEEFHVGFEFEMKEPTMEDPYGSWFGSVFGGLLIKDGGNHMYSTDLKNFIKYIKYEEVRVKYLDKEDIESLGWNTTSSKTNYRHFINSTKSEYDTPQVILECIDEYEHVYDIIRLIIEGGKRHYLFRGIIKNKSELKVLMKQLNLIK